MGFLSPLFLAGLAAVAVPVVLHLFRRRADTVVPFSAVRFLRHAPVEQARRRRLRELLLLALRATALALLALSFARPYFAAPQASESARLTIVAVDASYSVSTPGQVRRARELARAAVDEAAAGGQVALVRFDVRAEVAAAPTSDRALVRAAVAGTTPGAAGTRFGSAVAAAVDLAAGRPARLVVVTDMQQRGWAEPSGASRPASLEIEARDVGAAAGNLGLVSLERTAGGLAVRVRSDWPVRRSVTVTVAIDGRETGRQILDVEPFGTASAALQAALPARGIARAWLDDPDGYGADDERYVVLDPAPKPRVVLVTGEGTAAASSLYLDAALAAVDRDEFDVVRWAPRQGGRPWEGSAAVLLLGTYGVERTVLESMLQGGAATGAGLLVAAGPAVEPARLAAVLPGLFDDVSPAERPAAKTAVSLAPTDVRHPAFRSFEGDAGWLASVRFDRILAAAEPPGARVLARFSDGAPALVEHGGERRVLVFASDLSNRWNDFALHPAFVPFVHGLVRYVSSAGAPARRLIVGERPGLVRPGTAMERGARVAVNVDPAEADTARMTAAAFAAAVPQGGTGEGAPRRDAAAERERAQSLWRYGLMVMLAALVVESAVGRRT